MKNELPERLGLYLESSGLSQKELSQMAGISESIICRAIKGESELSLKNLVKIVQATTVSPNWLLGYDDAFDITYITPKSGLIPMDKYYDKKTTLQKIQTDCRDGVKIYVTASGYGPSHDAYYRVAMQYNNVVIVRKAFCNNSTVYGAMYQGILDCIAHITRPVMIYIIAPVPLGIFSGGKANSRLKRAIIHSLEDKDCSVTNVFFEGGADKLKSYINWCSEHCPVNPAHENPIIIKGGDN